MEDTAALLDLLAGAAARTRRKMNEGQAGERRAPPCFGFGRIVTALMDAGEITPTALAETLSIRLPSLAESLKKLEERGLVERRPAPENKKSCLVSLTQAGRTAAAQHAERRARFSETFFSPLSAGEKAALKEILIKLTEGRDAV